MSASIELGWNNGKLQAGAAGAAAIVDKASARMRGALASIGQGIGVGAGFAVFDTLKNSITGSLSAIASATVNLDSMRLGMTVLEGSTEGANARIQEMRDLAKLPGLGFEQVVQGDIRLRSAGLSAATSKRAIEEMGNALAAVGKGKADMDGVILAISQIASKGKVSAEEINQIAERVPQIRAIMKGTFGTADTEAIQKMNIPVERFIDMVIEGFSKTVPRAMVGLRGGWENLTDAMTAAAAGFGESIGKSMVDPMSAATEATESNMDKIKAAGSLAGDVITGVGATVGLFASVVKSASDAVGVGMTKLFGKEQEVKAFNAATISAAAAVKAESEELKKLKKEYDECEAVAQRFANEQADEERATRKNTEAITAHSKALNDANNSKLEAQLIPLERQGKAEAELDVIKRQIAAVQGRADKEDILTQLQTKRVEKETEIFNLKQEIAAEDQKAADVELKKKQRADEVAAKYATNLEMLDLELAILNAQASGHDRKAKQLEHERDVQEETARIVADTGLAYADAAKKAEQLVSAKERVDGRRDGNGRRKIHGYSQDQDSAGDTIGAGFRRAEMRRSDARAKAENGVMQYMGMEGMSASRLTPRADIGARTPATDAPRASGESEIAAVIKGYTEQTIEIFKQALA